MKHKLLVFSPLLLLIACTSEPAYEFVGITGYLNTAPLQLADLEGQVVLVDFWTYSCINCVRTLPYLVEWDRKYGDDGLRVIGVHTPEFPFEKKRENVEHAILKHNITYPVLEDNNYETWQAFGNRYWPHKYLFDAQGVLRYHHIGEGMYEEMERKIQELLAEIGREPQGVSSVEEQLPSSTTPELYAGYAFALPRRQYLGNGQFHPDASAVYTLPETFQPDLIYLDGNWTSNADSLQANEAGRVVISYTGKEVYVVLSTPVGGRIIHDGELSTVGNEVQQGILEVDSPGLYHLATGAYGTHLLVLDVDPGFQFHSFTFG